MDKKQLRRSSQTAVGRGPQRVGRATQQIEYPRVPVSYSTLVVLLTARHAKQIGPKH
jgi:hypothetical protein